MIEVFVKLWDILGRANKHRAFLLIGLMIIGMLMETLGIGLVMPAIALMTKVDLVNKYPAIHPILSYLGSPSQSQLVFTGMSVLLFIYTAKSFFLGFLSLIQLKFIFSLQEDLALRLFSKYMTQPYVFHLSKNSAQLIQNVSGETALFTQSVLNPGIILISELIVLVGIGTLMIVIEPVGSMLMILIFSLAAFIFGYLTKKRVGYWGKSRQFHDGQRIQHIQQGFGGVKDVKLLGREREFITQFAEHNHKTALIGVRQHFVAGLPRLWLDWLAVFCLVVLIFYMLSQGHLFEDLVPTLGFFAAAAFRLIPSVTKIVTAVQGFRFALPVLDLLHRELDKCDADQEKIATGNLVKFTDLIAINNVSYCYPDSSMKSISNICINVRKGESIGIIGPSGSGKSTLIDLILGLLSPSSGSILVDGVDISNDLRGWQSYIGYVPQTIYLTDDTLRRNVAFGLDEHSIDELAVKRAIVSAQLSDFVHELPLGLDTRVGERGVRLSGGQRQRIGIARALYHDPEILVFDEATSALDTETEKEIVNAIRNLQGIKTIIFVTHRLSTVEHLDRIYSVKCGCLLSYGSPADILRELQ